MLGTLRRLVKWAFVGTIAGLLVSSGLGSSTVVSAQGNEAAGHVWFHEDFSTRANRWRLYDLGKATVDYSVNGLVLRATASQYAVWSIPDNDLKPDRYDIEADVKLNSGAADARVGMIIGYRSENDMLVLAVSPDGRVHLGRYYYGIWNDMIKPAKIKLDKKQVIKLQAIVDPNHSVRVLVNGQLAGQTTIQDFRAAGFGLFALTGKSGGVDAAFSRFTVGDAK
jgi:hypothetical protein